MQIVFLHTKENRRKKWNSLETANAICDLMYGREIKDLAHYKSNQHRFMSAGKHIVVVSAKKTVVVILNGSL